MTHVLVEDVVLTFKAGTPVTVLSSDGDKSVVALTNVNDPHNRPTMARILTKKIGESE